MASSRGVAGFVSTGLTTTGFASTGLTTTGFVSWDFSAMGFACTGSFKAVPIFTLFGSSMLLMLMRVAMGTP
ncbi:MAG: hypothetical protein K9J32_02580 [Synechococcus lacustris]|nr:hypothetical protein [Synechococcus lacustris]MCP9793963.1 hypothetical protein [Synechococcus lacustris L1F-Slac]MCP9810694.1 hypothetical protein [Synechococcus lacustris Maggiore-St4-Slac]MCP9813164.1 hypothetical protein [Synechococcus lacustris L1E-Slac]